MSVEKIISAALEQGIIFSISNGELEILFKKKPERDLLQLINANKHGIVAVLQARRNVTYYTSGNVAPWSAI